MDNHNCEKLKKLNINIDEKHLRCESCLHADRCMGNNEAPTEKKVKKENWFREHEDFIPSLLKWAGATAGVAAGAGVASGVVAGAIGCEDVNYARFFGGMLAGGLSWIVSLASSAFVADAAKGHYPKNLNGELGRKVGVAMTLASLVGSLSASPVIGAQIGSGTHKLTKSIIEHFKPQHQIEQPAEIEPAPTIDEISTCAGQDTERNL